MNIQDYIQSGVIESYVLGMADAHEAAEIQQLSHVYPEIKEAINKFEASVESAAFANKVQPLSQVKDNLFIALKNEFETSGTENNAPVSIDLNEKAASTITFAAPVRNINSGWLKYAVAASVILLALSGGLNVYLYNKAENVKSDYLALLKQNSTVTADNRVYQAKMQDINNSLQLISNPSMIKVALPGVPGKEQDLATVFWDSKTKDVYLLANNLPKITGDKQYQLWALVDGVPVDAGLVSDCNGICKLRNIQKAQAFAITLEKKGGSPTPNLSLLQVMGKVG